MCHTGRHWLQQWVLDCGTALAHGDEGAELWAPRLLFLVTFCLLLYLGAWLSPFTKLVVKLTIPQISGINVQPSLKWMILLLLFFISFLLIGLIESTWNIKKPNFHSLWESSFFNDKFIMLLVLKSYWVELYEIMDI